MAYTLKRNIATLLQSALCGTIGLTSVSLLAIPAHSAPTVTGHKGCIMKPGGTAGHVLRPGEADSTVYDICNDSGQNNWQSGDFVSAGEINGALAEAEKAAQTYVDGKIVDVNVRIDEDRQSIAENRNNITNITNHNAAQDRTLNDHEQRITANTKANAATQNIVDQQGMRIAHNENDIAQVQAGAVFYNRDANGNKTGGITFNDGTGKAVQLGNVAAGKVGTDAANVDQLSGTLDGLGGGAHVNVDGSVTGPTYQIGGATFHNVGAALEAQDRSSVRYSLDENGKTTNNVMLTGGFCRKVFGRI